MGTTAPPEDGGVLEEGEIHDILRNSRRRLTIESLRKAEHGSLSVRDLSEQIAGLETGETPPPRDKRQSVYVSLQQTHLPKLDELEIVDHDPEERTVSLGEHVSEVEVYMEVVPEYGLSWGEYYFALGLLGLLVTVAALVGVPFLADIGSSLAVTVTVVASLFFVVVMLSATWHVHTQQDRTLFERFRR